MDRRKFFRLGINKIKQGVVTAAEAHVESKAKHWIRPPFAKNELDFLLLCTRCDDCISACPHNVIFPLPFSRGAEVAGTPALDLLNKGCHLCADWPCVNACEPNALSQSDLNTEVETDGSMHQAGGLETESATLVEEVMPPKLAEVMIDQQHCLPYLGPECGACRGSCPIPDTLIFENEKPKINTESCIGCGLCREACIADPKAISVSAV